MANAGMAELVRQVQHGTPEARLEATTAMRRKLSVAHAPPLQEAIDAGAVPLMVGFLSDGDSKLQFEASWVLTNIASGTSSQTQAVVKQGAVPPFVKLLTSPNFETREQALWALSNIAGDSAELRDHVFTFDPMTPILQLIVESEQEGKVGILRNAVWALSNLCRGKPPPALSAIAPALPFLGRLVHCTDRDVLTDTLWALSYIGDGPSERIDALLQTGALGKVAECLNLSESRVLQPALRVVGNVATGSDQHTDVAVQCGILQFAPKLLSHTKASIRKEVLWLLSNVAAGTKAQLQAVLESDVFPRVLELATTDSAEVRKEAVWVIGNAVVGANSEQLKYIADAGSVKTLCEALDQLHDASTMNVLLDALRTFLKHGDAHKEQWGGENPYCAMVEEAGGLSTLEKLQEDGNPSVYSKVIDILTTFFEVEDEPTEADAPSIPAGGFNFGA